MDIQPGEITSMAYANQVRINNAIEKDIINVATLKPCACVGAKDYADVYTSSINK